jgi:hypothetical protein
MSALPAQISSPAPPAARGVSWITIQVAAERAGMSEGHLSRTCGELCLAAGLARLEKPAGGGSARWIIREDADPKLARIKMPDQLTLDLRALKPAQRERILRKERLVKGWQQARCNGLSQGQTEAIITEQYLAHLEGQGIVISRRALYDWESKYRGTGLAGLLDRRGGKLGDDDGAGGAGPEDDPFLDCVKALYLSPAKLTKRACWKMACQKARESGWGVKQYRTTCLALAQLPMSLLIKRRDGEDAYVARCEPSIERDYSTLHSNEQWVGYHHQFDVMVNVGGRIVRPWLTAWMDMRSRRIMGWCIYGHAPNQNSILSALRGGILEHGVPESVCIDNGKDFDSYAFHGRTKQQRWQIQRGRIEIDENRIVGIFNHLQCAAHFCWAYHGQSKPIERWFGTLEDRFGRTWPTYCGNKPENKPEILADQLDAGAAPALAEFIAAFSTWLEADYHASAHGGDGMDGRSPGAVHAASWNGHAKRTATAEILDLLLMKQSRPVRVTKNGVRWNGLQYGQYAAALFPLIGQEVYLRIDERDITSVQIWSLEDRFICLASANARIPANAKEQDLREAIAMKKRHRRLMRDYIQKRPRMVEDIPDLMIRAAVEMNRQRRNNALPTEAGPAKIEPIRTALEGELPALQRAMGRSEPLKLAAGAENLDQDVLFHALRGAQSEEPEPAEELDLLAMMSGESGNKIFQYDGDPPNDEEEPCPSFHYEPASEARSRTRRAERQRNG